MQIFDIIYKEGMRDGDVVVHDCLHLLCNLVDSSPSTQRSFCELGSLGRLAPLLDPSNLIDEEGEDGDPDAARMGGVIIIQRPQQKEGLRLALRLLGFVVSRSCSQVLVAVP